MRKRLLNSRGWACALLLVAPLLGHAQFPSKDAANAAKVTPDLLVVQQTNGAPAAPSPGSPLQRSTPYLIKDGKIAIEAAAAEGQDGNALLQQLQALGLTDGVAYDRLIFGFLPFDKIDDLKNVPSLQFARPSYKPKHNVGKVTSQGDSAMRAGIARRTYNVSGAGVKVGVISDSYNALGGAPAGVASGDLPANVQVLDDFPGGEDEGRAMAEIVHDVAPGAAIAFNTAYKGQAGFAKGIRDLAAAGCSIITDDIYYFAEPFFQDGIISQAIRDVVTNKAVTYFTSQGNSERQSYQSAFVNGKTLLTAPYSTTAGISMATLGYPHDFGGGNYFQNITIPANGEAVISFQWDDRFYSVNGAPGARTDMDLIVLYNGLYLPDLSSAYDNLGDDPVELTFIQNNSAKDVTLQLALVKYAGPDPTIVKWVNNNASYLTIQYDTKSPSVVGHSNEKTAISVGAARYDRTPAYRPSLPQPVVERFSSTGGTPILFDVAGNRLTTPEIRQKPEIVAANGGNTTFFGFDYEGDGFPNFFGTSAAAPHAAAVGALMKEKSGNTIGRNQILSILENTAALMNDSYLLANANQPPSVNFTTGYGFIQADKALAQISGPVATTPFSITGVTTVNCQTVTAGLRRVTFTPQYTGLNGQTVTFSVVNETLPMTNPGPYTVNLYTDNPTVTLKAMQGNATVTFTYNWLNACNNPTSTTPTEPNPGVLTITGVTGVSCTAVTATQRRLRFTPQYAGVNDQTITFSVINETLPTTDRGPVTLNLYIDNPVIRLKAVQAGTPGEATFTYNWLAACNSGSPRQGVAEAGSVLSIRTLGNPVVGELTVEVTGAAEQALSLKLTDTQGRVLENRNVEQAGAVERHTFDVSKQAPGLLLLHAATNQQQQISKILKR